MAVNGPATEQEVLTPEVTQVLPGSPGHDPMFVPIVWDPNTDTFTREPTLIQVRNPERPL